MADSCQLCPECFHRGESPASPFARLHILSLEIVVSFKPCTTECIIPLADHSFEHNTFVSWAMLKGLIINFTSTLDPTPGTISVLVNMGIRKKE